MLMYIPLLYRTVYRIVFEKVTRAKESMRMMGLKDVAYWLSWLAYYSLINFCLVFACWVVLMVGEVMNSDSAFMILVFMWVYG